MSDSITKRSLQPGRQSHLVAAIVSSAAEVRQSLAPRQMYVRWHWQADCTGGPEYSARTLPFDHCKRQRMWLTGIRTSGTKSQFNLSHSQSFTFH